MSPPPSAAEVERAGRMRAHEALLLADSLRGTRLTLLLARAGAARDALLNDGVVPLLARRETDRPDGSAHSRGVVTAFIDRRAGGVAAGPAVRQREHLVYFSAWGDDPLPALCAAVGAATSGDAVSDASLADRLGDTCGRLRSRLLVVLDGFERFLALDPGAPATARFARALAEAVERPHLPVSFLLAVDDRFDGRLDGLRRAIHGFDDATIRLIGLEGGSATASTVPAAPVGVGRLPILSDAVPARSAPPQRRKRAPKPAAAPSAPIGTDAVYALIESTLSQTAVGAEPWRDTAAAPPAVPLPPAVLTAPQRPSDAWLAAAIDWCRRRLRLE